MVEPLTDAERYAEARAYDRDVGRLEIDPAQPGIARSTVDPTIGYLFGNRARFLTEIINYGAMRALSWPAGAEDEARHRAELARKAEPIPISGTISAGDLEQLDELILLLDAMADHGLTGNHYDFAWNLRNQLVPFPEGHALYAPGDD